MLAICCAGNSHLHAIQWALRLGHPIAEKASVDAIYLNNLEAYKRQATSAAHRTVDYASSAELRSHLGGTGAPVDVLVLSIHGNAHNFVALAMHRRPFDFVLETEPDLPLVDDAEIIPEAFVTDVLAGTLGDSRAALESILSLWPDEKPAILVDAPPPLPARHVAAHPGVFADLLAERGIAPDRVRYKVWRRQCAMVRALADDLGLHYLPAPDEALSPDLSLRAELCHVDPTHANFRYGRLVLDQIDDAVRRLGH